jgi:outer membrane protein assembly factor BamB
MKKSLCIGIILLFIFSSLQVIGLEGKTPIPIDKNDTGLIDNPWPMKGQNSRHTSLSQYDTPIDNVKEKWRFYVNDWSQGGPSIANDGTIYFSSWDHYLYAINPDGTLKWKANSGYIIEYCVPAIGSDDTIYFCNVEGDVFALNPDGSGKWKKHIGGSIYDSICISPDDILYIAITSDIHYNSAIVALDNNGNELWRIERGGIYFSSPAVDDDGVIYVSSFNGDVYAINPNGSIIWDFISNNEIRSTPSIDNDGNVLIQSGGTLYCLNSDDGTIIWDLHVSSTYLSPSIDSDGVIYLGNYRGDFYAIYPNGEIKWTVDFDTLSDSAFWQSSVAISNNGILYIGTSIDYPYSRGGEIIALDSDDGTIIWQKIIANNWISSSPSIGADGTVYICSANVKDDLNGYAKDFSYLHAFNIIVSNQPPEAPIITGPLNAQILKEIYYNFTSNDPDNNPISYYIDWDDGSFTDWTGCDTNESASGEEVWLSHTYLSSGDYTIKAKARDSLGAESDWSILEVSMPKPHLMDLLLDWFCERFPLLCQIFN